MTALPRLSVIVPVFNGGKTLDATISSLLMVDYPTDRIQILIVDNHSSDQTAQLIQGYPRVEYAFEGHRTSYAARNKGGLRAVGDVLADGPSTDLGELADLRTHAAAVAPDDVPITRSALLSPSRFLVASDSSADPG